jgi:hypothetical protein
MSDVHESFASMSMKTRGRHGCDHMVTGFTAISAYYHYDIQGN